MERDPWLRALLILLLIIAAFFLLERAWQLAAAFSDIILLFALSWLLAFILNPTVSWLSGHPVPSVLARVLGRVGGTRWAGSVESLHLPRAGAVALVYLGLALILVGGSLFLVPVTIAQLSQLGADLPGYVARTPEWIGRAEKELANWGLKVDLKELYQAQNLAGRLQALGPMFIQNALAIGTGLLSVVANMLLLLILSFYIMLDGHHLGQQALAIVPEQYRDEVHYFARSIDRTFGGFMRGQLIQSLLYGLGTGLAMGVAGLEFAVVVGFFAGLLMLVPLIGIPLSLLPPVAIALFQSPGVTLWLAVALLVYQQVIVNIVMPRVMSEMVGLHPLLIIAAMLVGIKVAGFWGAFFAIPVAGVVYAMAVFFYQRVSHRKIEEPGTP